MERRFAESRTSEGRMSDSSPEKTQPGGGEGGGGLGGGGDGGGGLSKGASSFHEHSIINRFRLLLKLSDIVKNHIMPGATARLQNKSLGRL